MKPSYSIDAAGYGLDQIKNDLAGRKLIPSRKPLLTDLEENFRKLQAAGIESLQDLITSLKDKKRLSDLSQTTGVAVEYLTLLRREANSYLPKPVRLDRLAGFSSGVIDRLADQGINNTRQFFERSRNRSALEELSSRSGIPFNTLQHLQAVSDLTRAYGVGPVFAELLFQAGITSLQEFIAHSPEGIIRLYEQTAGKKADFSESDLQFSQAQVRMLGIK